MDLLCRRCGIEETGGSESYEDEQAGLLKQLQEDEDCRQMTEPVRKAHHNIASQLRIFYRHLKDDMPTLTVQRYEILPKGQ